MVDAANGHGNRRDERSLVRSGKALQAVQLRRAGRTYREIAEEMKYASTSSAYEAVQVGMRETLREPAEELRTLELERLDNLQAAVWEDAVNPGIELAQRIAAGNQVLKIIKQRSTMMGLDYDESRYLRIEDVRAFMELIRIHVLDRYVPGEAIPVAKQEMKRLSRQMGATT